MGGSVKQDAGTRRRTKKPGSGSSFRSKVGVHMVAAIHIVVDPKRSETGPPPVVL
jgi:hypothetical protein